MRDGEPVEEAQIVVAQRIFDQKATWKDSKIQAALAKSGPDRSELFLLRVTSPLTAHVIVLRNVGGVLPAATSTTLDIVTSPGRREILVYQDGELFITSHYKNDTLHGRYEMRALKLPNFTSTAMTMCYENGEQIKTVNCDVE